MTSSKPQRAFAMVDAIPWRCGKTSGHIATSAISARSHMSVAAREIRSASSALRRCRQPSQETDARESSQCYVARREHGSSIETRNRTTENASLLGSIDFHFWQLGEFT